MKKLKIIILSIGIFSLCIGHINAQQVVGTAGNQIKNSHASLSWTIGEVAIQTLESTNLILTQGFHQTKLTVTGINLTPNNNPDIKAYPNPAYDHVNLKMGNTLSGQNWQYLIYDKSGKKLMEKKITSDLSSISLGTLPKATYFLKVFRGNKESKVFKIVKQ